MLVSGQKFSLAFPMQDYNGKLTCFHKINPMFHDLVRSLSVFINFNSHTMANQQRHLILFNRKQKLFLVVLYCNKMFSSQALNCLGLGVSRSGPMVKEIIESVKKILAESENGSLSEL